MAAGGGAGETAAVASPAFRTDLYEGTASFYEHFRPAYPAALLDDLTARTGRAGHRRLLDLACGTGQITRALAGAFAEVWAVDQDADMVRVGRDATRSAGVANVRWITGRAEAVPAPTGAFDLVTIGNAFHRLRRETVAAGVRALLAPGGSLTLLWSDAPWRGEEAWQAAARDVIEEWTARLGAADRVPGDWAEVIDERPHAQVLAGVGLAVVDRVEVPVRRTWTPASVAGFAYSTSVLARPVVGDHADAFERDLRHRLLTVEPSGVLRQHTSAAYDLARLPAA